MLQKLFEFSDASQARTTELVAFGTLKAVMRKRCSKVTKTLSFPSLTIIPNGIFESSFLVSVKVKIKILIFSDRILTGSFDKTAKIWNPTSANCLNTLWGHTAEIVAAEFNPNQGEQVVTCSMDNTARVFHAETAQEVHLFGDHRAEVISARFNKDGNLLLTASFDQTAIVWDMRMKELGVLPIIPGNVL